MEKISMQEIEQYWLDNDYIKIQKSDINDFCRLWAEQEGLILPETFSIAENNSMFFTKINSEKHAVNLILEKFGYPIVETESLTMDMTCGIMRATQLFEKYGNGVIRANRFAGGGGTFIVQREVSIKMMISTLINNPKGPILPVFSPYYKAPIEYGVFLVNGKIELVVAKHLNEDTGLHNLSLGAKASVVKDKETLDKLNDVCTGLSELFGIGFGRIDVMSTEKGLKIVELSVPNFKKFSLQDEECMKISKDLFLKYYAAFYR